MSDIPYDTTTPDGVPMKRCPGCGERKPHSEFSKNKTNRDGLQPHCKQCVAKYQRENADKERERKARWRLENADKVREYHARYRLENADKLREKSARYYLKNTNRVRKAVSRYQREHADKVRERSARRYRENSAKVQENVRRYHRENPDKARATAHRRRAAKRALPSQWTDSDARRMLAYWKNCCAVCGQHVEPNNAFYILAADHWIPLTSPECPGTVPWNMLPLCHSKIGNAMGCNNAKNAKDPIEWLNSRYSPEQVKAILKRIDKYFASVKR